MKLEGYSAVSFFTRLAAGWMRSKKIVEREPVFHEYNEYAIKYELFQLQRQQRRHHFRKIAFERLAGFGLRADYHW